MGGRLGGIALMPLRQLVNMVRVGEPLRGPTAVFTVDDGYLDFERVAAPVFAEFDCPVTVFVTTEVASGRIWFWWDKVSYVMLHTRHVEHTVRIDGVAHRYALDEQTGRLLAAAHLSERLKWMSDATRNELIVRTALDLEVELPETPPPEYRALDWAQVRELEKRGVDFGPHSRTHPIVGREDDGRARDEIHGSWSDLQRECLNPSPVFCYPNGTLESFSVRDMELVSSAGMAGAVSLYPGAIDPRTFPEPMITCLPRRTLPARPERTPFVVATLPHFARKGWSRSGQVDPVREREREARTYTAQLGKAAEAGE